jgi:hypothetical protein
MFCTSYGPNINILLLLCNKLGLYKLAYSIFVMKKNMKLKWLLQSAGGLILTGAGLSLAIDAGISKMQGGEWFWYGTGALVVFQAGLCFVIDSVRYKN